MYRKFLICNSNLTRKYMLILILCSIRLAVDLNKCRYKSKIYKDVTFNKLSCLIRYTGRVFLQRIPLLFDKVKHDMHFTLTLTLQKYAHYVHCLTFIQEMAWKTVFRKYCTWRYYNCCMHLSLIFIYNNFHVNNEHIFYILIKKLCY